MALAGLLLCAAAPAALARQESQTPPAEPPTEPATEANAAPGASATADARQFDADFRTDLYLGNQFSVGEAETTVYEELDDIYMDKEPVVDVPPFDSPLNAFRELTQKIDDSIGLRIGVAYTAVFQQATGGKSGAGGDFDVFGTWDLINRGEANTGRVVWGVENRHRLGGRVASDLRPELGTFLAPTNGFNDRGWVVRDLFWQQNLLDDKLRIIIGRADPTDYFGAHRMQNKNALFSNRQISGTAALPSPGHGLTAVFTYRPNDLLFISGGSSNAYGDTTEAQIESLFDEWDLFSFGEVGFTPYIKNVGQGRYTASVTYVDPRDRGDQTIGHDWGLSLVADQDLGERFQVFARYNYQEEALTNIHHLIQGGVGVSGLLGSQDNMTGLAFSYADPKGPGREEKVVETFHRFQLTRFTQFSVGYQLIIDPTFAPDDDVIGVFTARIRIAF
ncbi:MAG: hypothetical protein ACTS3F_08855 [Phycisphaerales bacterium]